MIVLPSGIKPTLGRAFFAPFGDDAGSMRLMPKRDFQHFVRCRHFQVNGQADFPHNRVEVSVANMPAVFAQMDGDAIAARCFDHMCGAHRIGMHSATRISDRRNMVDIDAKTQTRRML
jgi:hypothetical protein